LEHQIGVQRALRGPADDLSRVEVHHRRQG
jgi:hypothetical protein